MSYSLTPAKGTTDASGKATIQIGPVDTQRWFFGYVVAETVTQVAATYTLVDKGGYPLAGFGGALAVVGPILLQPSDWVNLQVANGPINTQILINIIGDVAYSQETLAKPPEPTSGGPNTNILSTISTLVVTGTTDLQGGVTVEGPARFKGGDPWYDVTHPSFAGGADPTGGADSTAAIAAAIAAIGTQGTLFFPPGTYLVSGAGTECILVNKNCRMVGAHTLGSVIQVAASVGAGTDVIRVSPPGATGFEFFEMHDLRLAAVSGTPGRHALNLDISAAGQSMDRLVIQDCYFSQFGGEGIHIGNPIPNANGFFTSVIERNTIFKGIHGVSIGDSVVIHDNTLPGTAADLVGIDVSMVSGSSNVLLDGNNMSNRAGILVRGGPSNLVEIVNNNVQPNGAYTGAGAAVVDVAGSTGRIATGIVRRNLILVSTGATDTLRLDTVTNADVDDNQLITQSGRCLVVTANVVSAKIGRKNQYIIAGGGSTRSIAAAADVNYDSAPLHFSAITSSAQVANTNAQTAFNRTYTVPANSLEVGDIIRVRASGQHAIGAATGVTITVRIAGVNMATAVAASPAVAGRWDIEHDMAVRVIGAGGVVNRGFSYGQIGAVFFPNAVIGAAAVDTTVAQVVDVTVTFTVANPGNTAQLDHLSVEILKGGQTA